MKCSLGISNFLEISLYKMYKTYYLSINHYLMKVNLSSNKWHFVQTPFDLWFYLGDYHIFIQFSSVTQSCLTLCNPMNHSTPGLPIHHQLPESTQTQVHWVGDDIQLSLPLSSPSPPALNLSQHQGLLQWVSSSHQVAKVLESQLQHQFFQWTLRTDLL